MRAKLLYVEDHADTAELFSLLLGLDNFEIVMAQSVAEAKAAAAADVFDLLVCDVGLPDGDGCELMAHLHSMYGLEGVAVTAHGKPEDVRRCQEAGFVRHLMKPIGFRQIERAISEVLAFARAKVVAEIAPLSQIISLEPIEGSAEAV